MLRPYLIWLMLCLPGLFLTSIQGWGQVGFTENKGQWHSNVVFRAELTQGYCYIDQQGIMMQVLEVDFGKKLHDWWQSPEADASGSMHAVRMRFVGADMSQISQKNQVFQNKLNFFLGNDSAAWASDVETYKQIKIQDVYPGIDLRFDANERSFKYDFIVDPGVSTDLIAVEIEGATSLMLSDGDLLIGTSVGSYRELKPFAYQLAPDGKIETVACKYVLNNNQVSYAFPEGYDISRELIIDPEISFSSYIGSITSNFGFTASYDSDGNLYAGALVFGAQYPTIPGSYQVDFAGGSVDMAISKFNADGTQLAYSTFLGGTGNEAPHSIVINDANEIYVLGSTSSDDFPVLTSAFQNNFQGGSQINGIGYFYDNGSDIFVSKLSENGNALLASTFVGGSGNDGVGGNTNLVYNYGDRFRGEIVLDAASNAYIASVTNSQDFPIVDGYQNFNGFTQSGVIFKLSSNLSQMLWSTYSGGSEVESAIGLHLASDNSVYFTGATNSTNLPISTNAFQPANAGNIDGYIGHISADGATLLHCTYNGTSGRDQNFFVQLDDADNVYVVGQSEAGNYPISPGVYSNNNSGQFIQKFSADLTTSLWSTQVGSGSNQIDISPAAFLVTTCGQIYLSGWGGNVNTNGNTNGMPITPDAFQSSTDGSDFYIMVLEADASALAYGTYFGGSASSEHVDGGTSRFDKNGTVYQAVCAGCFDNDDFPTQPGVWSETNGSTQCNLGVFKFRLSAVNAMAEIDLSDIPGGILCPGQPFNLINESVGTDTYAWSMGDGTFSTVFEPTHSYENPGSYTIQLVASDSEGCLLPDSVIINVEVQEGPSLQVSDPDQICAGETVQLTASGTSEYLWVPSTGLNADNIANPVFNGTTTTEYTVTGTSLCGTDVATVLVTVGSINASVSEDVEICPGESTTLVASGGATYSWNPATGLSNASISSPTSAPASTTIYGVTITSEDGCEQVESVEVTVLPPPPNLTGNNSYISCNGESVLTNISGADVYSWTPTDWLSNPSSGITISNPPETTTYILTGSNVCGEDIMEVTVSTSAIGVDIAVDSVVCYNMPFILQASGGNSYRWNPESVFADPQASNTTAAIEYNTLITLTGKNEDGCIGTATKYLRLHPRAEVRAGNDQVINYGDEVMLESFSIYPITWQESPYLSCINCNYPVADPLETTTIYAEIISPEGCVEKDSVGVFVRGNIYVPNSFTPNEDGLNDLFRAEGIDIAVFKMEIFDRWGVMVFQSEDMREGWNGSTNGSEYYASSGVYAYRIVAREEHGDLFEIQGHVTLIR